MCLKRWASARVAGRILLLHKSKHPPVQSGAYVKPCGCARNIAYLHFETGRCWKQIDNGSGAEPAQIVAVGCMLPLLNSDAGALLRFLLNSLLDAIDQGAGIGGWRQIDVDFIPHPLTAVEKLKCWPRIAKLLMNEIRRPVGRPLSARLPSQEASC